MIRVVFIGLLIAGCGKKSNEPKLPNMTIQPTKYCVQNCMRHIFKTFHSRGRSWGTGSSSMNGLSQTQIFDRVKKECEVFYKDEKCCHKIIGWERPHFKTSDLHGLDYGACP